MKHLKLITVLLALSLAAMVMVPMVSAVNNNYSDEKIKLVESSYIPVDFAYKDASTTLQSFILSNSLDEKWNGATLNPKPLTVYDLNGAILSYRFSAEKNGVSIGQIDAAASKVVGGPVLSIGIGPNKFDEKTVDSKINEIAAGKFADYNVGSKTLVSYNFPRLGVLAILTNAKTGETKRIVIDVTDYSIIPEKKSVMDGDLGAWSFYDDISVDDMTRNIQKSGITPLYASQKLLSVTRQQQSSENWCAVTVAQMISDYYGYWREQQAIADKMGNGGGGGSTPAMELTYYQATTGSGGLGKTNSIDVYSSSANWDNAADEIDLNRPLKVGNLGHARTISGYKIQSGSNYLYLNDPGQNLGSYWLLYTSTFNNYVYVR